MQAIYDSIKYDTDADNATKVASWSNLTDKSNFRYKAERLYQTDNGRWFLHGKGHAKTKYAKTTGDGMKTMGEEIRPMSDEEAYRWLEAHNKIEQAEEHFEDRIEKA